MAILLKELTIRYFPKSDQLPQLLKDYYAVFGLWQQHQQPGFASERKTEIVNDVMQQVGTMAHTRILDRLSHMTQYQPDAKLLQKLNHAAKMENWSDFTAALTDVIRTTTTGDRSGEYTKFWSSGAKNLDVSPSLWNLFGGRPPQKSPAWKQFDKPMKGEPMPIQRDLPMAGGQMDIPFPKPPPPLPANLPELPKDAMSAEDHQKVNPNLEMLLKSFGYDWDDNHKIYQSKDRPVFINFRKNRTALVSTNDGNITKEFPNYGELLRALGHAKRRRGEKQPTGEPATQLKEFHYRMLFGVLYS